MIYFHPLLSPGDYHVALYRVFHESLQYHLGFTIRKDDLIPFVFIASAKRVGIFGKI